LLRGGYVLAESSKKDPAVILIATGSEVELAVEARKQLEADGVATRVVSMPSMELFEAQDASYQKEVLPPAARKRLAIEAGVRQGWDKYATEDGDYVVMTRFGASGPYEELAEKFGFTIDNVVKKAKALAG
jgi:transketolase